MRVLQINAVYKRFSTGRSVMELNEDLNEAGIESFAACSRTYGTLGVYQIGNEYTIKLHGLLSRLTGKQGYFSKGETKKLIEYIGEIKPDVVHLHNIHANFLNFPMLLEYLAKNDIPTVVSLYDCWFFTGKCMHYYTEKCYKWETQCHDCPLLHEGNVSWFKDSTKQVQADKIRLLNAIPRLAIVGISNWITDECRRSPVSANAKIIDRVYLWIDVDLFKPCDASDLREKLGLEDKFVIIGVAEQWGEPKGLDRFIKLASRLPDDKVIILVGNPAPDVVLPDNIISVGRTDSQQELAQYYSMADVFVTFSYQETFGKVSAEALACGTPIICYNSTANPELVGDGCGIAVELGEEDGVFNAINEIAKKPKSFYSERCTEFAKSNFSRKGNTAQFIDIYRRLADK